MNGQEIIEMAEKTGVAFASDEYPDIWQTYMHVGKAELEAFAKLVAAKEREACARLVIQRTEIPKDALRRGTGVRDNLVIAGEQIAAAIRARSCN